VAAVASAAKAVVVADLLVAGAMLAEEDMLVAVVARAVSRLTPLAIRPMGPVLLRRAAKSILQDLIMVVAAAVAVVNLMAGVVVAKAADLAAGANAVVVVVNAAGVVADLMAVAAAVVAELPLTAASAAANSPSAFLVDGTRLDSPRRLPKGSRLDAFLPKASFCTVLQFWRATCCLPCCLLSFILGPSHSPGQFQPPPTAEFHYENFRPIIVF
jgi:hypothetical protein